MRTALNSQKLPGKKTYSKSVFPLLFMTVPFFILVLAFAYVPLWGWSIAFVDYFPGVSIFTSKFVGLKYFIYLFSGGSEFLRVMRNTLALSCLGLLTTPIPIVLAVMISEVKGRYTKKIIQTITSFPNFVSWIIVYSLFFSFLSVDDGLINTVLINLHIINQPFDLLANENATWAVQTFASVWKNTGWSAIVYIAAIAGIDQEQYQAADVDGANRFHKIFYVTIPGILPTYSVILLLSAGNLISTGFDQYYIFHNSLNHNMIEVLDTYTYRLGIQQMDFSFATAVGIFKTFVSVVLLFIANNISKRATGQYLL